MNLFRRTVLAIAASLLAVSAAKADPFNTITTTYQLTTADTKETARPSRSGTPQDWSGTETYTGTIGTTQYAYKTFTFASSLFAGAPYLDISTFDPVNGSSYFLTAYAGSYDVNNRAANWLGDVGFSGNYQTNDGGDFQVILPTNTNLVLVLNSTAAGAVLPTYAFQFNIAGYSDTNYSDPLPAQTPEPSSLLLVGTGVLGVAGVLRRRFV